MFQDLRYGVRMLLKNPGFTLVAVFTLALGICGVTTQFSIVDAALLRSLPYPGADRVVQMREVSEDGSRTAFADPDFRDVRERNRSLEAVAEYAGSMETITGGSEPLRARVLSATNDFFRVLGVAPLVGRAFLPEDAKDGGKQVAVVSHGFWQKALGGRADLAGVKLRISDRVFDVVGVMPPGFSYDRARRRRISVDGGLRERGEPVARAGDGAAERVCRARRARGDAVETCGAVRD